MDNQVCYLNMSCAFLKYFSKMNEENFYMIQNNIHAKSVF